MSRPESVKDVKDRMVQIGTMDLERIVTIPALLKHYTAFIEQLQKMYGEVEPSYGMNVKFSMVRDQKQLESQLASEQYMWDENKKDYEKALRADPSDPVKEYAKDRIKEWAKEEGLPDPFDCFAANDPELRRIREELGMNEDDE